MRVVVRQGFYCTTKILFSLGHDKLTHLKPVDRRKKGLLTRDKCKLYLKQHCDPSQDGIWRVKVRTDWLTGS